MRHTDEKTGIRGVDVVKFVVRQMMELQEGAVHGCPSVARTASASASGKKVPR
jgi:hypothetical protein